MRAVSQLQGRTEERYFEREADSRVACFLAWYSPATAKRRVLSAAAVGRPKAGDEMKWRDLPLLAERSISPTVVGSTRVETTGSARSTLD